MILKVLSKNIGFCCVFGEAHAWIACCASWSFSDNIVVLGKRGKPHSRVAARLCSGGEKFGTQLGALGEGNLLPGVVTPGEFSLRRAISRLP
jgi:hypothetical protein